MVERKKGFTLIELLVVIAIIAVLMAVLMPALQRVKKQARLVVCLANLHQWSLIFSMYCDDNDTKFFSGDFNGTMTNMGCGRFWRLTMKPYSKDEKMWVCPQATKARQEDIPQGQESFTAWEFDGDVGSYGINGWILNLPAADQGRGRSSGWGRSPASDHWFTATQKKANTIPVFTGSWWVDSWPRDTDVPPGVETGPADTPEINEMQRVCVDRHNGFVGALFCDWSVRKVGLKELWTLKWHRSFNTANAYTTAGGATQDKWPVWMRNYKDY